VDAPIAAGDELGEMTVSYNGTVYGTVKLLALSDVSASWLLVARRDVADFSPVPSSGSFSSSLSCSFSHSFSCAGTGADGATASAAADAPLPPVIAAAGAEHRGRQTVKGHQTAQTDGVSRRFPFSREISATRGLFVLDFCPFPCYTAFIVR